MAFSPDGRFLATGAAYLNAEPRTWDAATGRLLHKFKALREGSRAKLPNRDGFTKVQSVVFSPDGRRLLTISNEEKITIRNTTTPDTTASKQEEELPFTPARIWDVATGKQLAALQAGEFKLSCACFSPDGRKVLTGDSTDKSYAIYTGTGLHVESGQKSNSGGATFARIYDVATGKELLKLPHQGTILRAEFSADGGRVLTSTASGRFPNTDIKMWDAENGTLLFSLETSSSQGVACFDPYAKRIAVFGGRIRIHDAASGKKIAEYEGHDVWRENWELRHAGLSPFSADGKKLLAYGKNGLGLFDLETGKQVVAFRGHLGAVKSALFSTDGRFVVTASDDQTARVWAAATGQELHVLRHKGSVQFALMSPNGRRVATASDTVRIWDLDLLAIAIQRKPRELSSTEKERFGIK
jgi:WD40 repeat protein